MPCKWLSDDFNDICSNRDCPACADFCPTVNLPNLCHYEEQEEKKYHMPSDYSGGILSRLLATDGTIITFIKSANQEPKVALRIQRTTH